MSLAAQSSSASPDPSPSSDLADRILRTRTEVFGHTSFRPGQEEVISRILLRRSTLAVMPTGSGKSLCYQLPAVMLDGLTVVVSPLIALIREQVQALRERGIAAASWTSADSVKDRTLAAEGVRSGALKLLFIAPERFRADRFVALVAAAKPVLMAIDEAHCISTWGHDFRPDYARLGEVIDRTAPARVIGLTATATPDVQRDIVRALRLDPDSSIVTGFDRPNLALSVEETRGRARKARALATTLGRWLEPEVRGRSRTRGSAIVYASTRKRCEEVAEELTALGMRAVPYHAGLPLESRNRAQEAFKKGHAEVVVATTAFGMGIDKPDVRVVVHYDIPNAPEAYYQEIGRGGRDGKAAGAVLLYDPGDLRLAFLRLEASCPTPLAVEEAFFALARRAREGLVRGGLDEVADDIEPTVGPAARAALIDLLRSRSIEDHPDGLRLVTERPSIDEAALNARLRHERRKLEAMIEYVTRAPCRRRFLVDYFGDRDRPERCGACDRCSRAPAVTADDELALAARMALSCVARLRGRYGRGRAIEVLLGSRSDEVLKRGLDQSSTYGLLASWTKEELGALFDAFARADLIGSTRDDYPKVFITPRGVRAMKAEDPVVLDFERTEVLAKTRAPRRRDRASGQ